MVIHKRKKNIRQRAGTTHGFGSMKKNRGAGHRGGRGNAGTGKRGDAKKPSIWKNDKYFGKNGFHSLRTPLKAISVRMIDDNADSWVKKGLITEKGGIYTIDLKKLGYDKLLGTGQVTKKLNITLSSITSKAEEKVTALGGSITVIAVKTPKTAEVTEKSK